MRGEAVMSWWKLAKAKMLPPRIEGGVPVPPRQSLRVLRCPDCPETFTDPEEAFAHVLGAHITDARRMLH